MPKLLILVGPPGSGKSTLAKEYEARMYRRVNQDSQGKNGHLDAFNEALFANRDIVVDRMNFDKRQRERYIAPARSAGYTVTIRVLHESRQTCLRRCLARQGHETISTEDSARSALNLFFSKYERPTSDEADSIEWVYPDGLKDECVVVDLDGTLCNIEHRLHHVRGEGKKNWGAFFRELDKDTPNKWCSELVDQMAERYPIVFASGRPDDHKRATETWLTKHLFSIDHLYMRCRGDHRDDTVAKEIILDFEILTRFKPLFFIDDRKRVVDLWRRRGHVALACHEGDF